MAIAVGMFYCDDKTKPMQYIPIAAVPMTNTRSPKPHYYTEGERESSMKRATSGKETKRHVLTAHKAEEKTITATETSHKCLLASSQKRHRIKLRQRFDQLGEGNGQYKN